VVLYDNAVGSGRVTVDSSGNLGIGTSLPSAKLTVAGGQITVTNSGAVNPAINFAGNGSGASGFQLGQNYNSQTFFVYDNAASSQRLTLDSAGNLGIGTSSPSYKLDLQGAAGVGAQIYETSTGTNKRLRITQESAYVKYEATYSSGGNAHSWWNGGTRQMDLDVTGNLGIGTSSPTAKLSVTGGAIAVKSTLGFGATFENTGSTGSYITFADTGNSSGVGTNNGALAFYTNTNTTERMRLDSSGNLGVGTSSPFNKLVVSNSGAAGLEIAPLLRDNVTAGASLLSYNRSGTAFVPMQFSGLDLRFLTSDTERLRIDGTGAFGINGANYGTSGQVLTSAGSGAAPSWATPTAGVTKQQAIAYSMFF
jgi:hypothetical protein